MSIIVAFVCLFIFGCIAIVIAVHHYNNCYRALREYGTVIDELIDARLKFYGYTIVRKEVIE